MRRTPKRIAVFGLGHRFQRMLEIMKRTARGEGDPADPDRRWLVRVTEVEETRDVHGIAACASRSLTDTTSATAATPSAET